LPTQGEETGAMMIAGTITVTQRGATTERVIIASGKSGVSSVLEIMTAIEIFAAIEERWMIYIGEGIAITMTTEEIFAAFGERVLEKQVITGTGEGVAINEKSRMRFSYSGNTG
jgi:hypothetical protein